MCFSLQTAFCQDFDNYQPLKNNGTLPSDFLSGWSETYRKDVSKISTKDGRRTKSDKIDFYKKTDFGLNKLMRSGLVVMEGEHTEYIRKVLDLVLKNRPELQKKTKLYLLRSSSVNAFATTQDAVYITYGLLSQIENEAQLALVLAHEVSHIEKNHGIDFYLKSKKIDRSSNIWSSHNDNDESSAITKSRFSKEHENEADALGIDLFLATQYSSKKLPRVFDVLRYAYLPFDEVPFDYSVLESEDLKLTESFKLLKTKSIKTIAEKEEDEKATEETSSHPNLSARKSYLENEITKVNNDKKVDFLISEAAFLKMQKIMRFELSEIYIKNQDYNEAIYNSFLLLQKNPKSIYLKKSIGKSLYFIAKYDNNPKVNYERQKTEDIEGESQRVFHIFEKMTPKEINILATNYLLHLEKEYPKDVELNKMVNDLLHELTYYHSLSFKDFKLKKDEPVLVKKVETNEETTNNKIDKIVQNSGNGDWHTTALSSFLADKTFQKRFEELSEKAEVKKLEDEKAAYKNWMKLFSSDHNNKPVQLGLDKIVIVNPIYLSSDQSLFGSGIKYDETEQGEKRFNTYIAATAEKANLKAVLLNKCSLKSGDMSQFNDMVELTDWIDQQNTAGEMLIVPSNQAQVEALAQKYDTNYFVWTGVVNIKRATDFVGDNPLSLAYGIYHSIKGSFSTFYYFNLYNVKTGKNVIIKSSWVDADDSYSVTSSQLYDAMLQIKSK